MRFNHFPRGVFSLLPLLECVSGQVGSAFTLYAYGNGLSGQQVFWADGLFFSPSFPFSIFTTNNSSQRPGRLRQLHRGQPDGQPRPRQM